MHRGRPAMRQEDLSPGLFLPNHLPRRQNDSPQQQQYANGPMMGPCGAGAGLGAKHFSHHLAHDCMPLVDQDLSACGMPTDHDALSPVACSGLSSPVPGISTPPRNGIDGTLINQLMFTNSSSSAAHLQQHHQQQQQATGGWGLASGSGDLEQLMAQLPQAQQQQLLLDAMQLSTSQPMMPPQQQQQQLPAACTTEQQWMEQLLGVSASNTMNGLDMPLQPSTPNQHPHSLQRQWSVAPDTYTNTAAGPLTPEQQLLLLQAAALGNTTAMPQPAALAAGSMSSAAMLQQMLQAAQAQEHQVQQQTQQLNAALALALLSGQPAAAFGHHQQLLLNNAAATAGMWSQQQLQQQAAAAAAALPLLNSIASLHPQLAGLSPAALLQSQQQLSAQLLSCQLPSAAAPASSAIAQLLSARLGGLVSHSAPAAAAAGQLWSGVPAAAAVGMDGQAGGMNSRRSRRNSRNSNALGTLAPTAADLFARRDRRSSSGKEAAFSQGSEQPLSAATLLPGMQLCDLAPGSFDEYWGPSVGDQQAASDASVLSGVTTRTSSSASSTTTDDASLVQRYDSANSSVCGSIVLSDDEAEQTPAPAAAAADSWADIEVSDAPKAGATSSDQTPAAGSPTGSQDSSTVGGCPAWFPGDREASGDDSWYLPRPPTSRLFVGNIGCWVDEAMLLSYFGKYGNVVDVQVMWNTKMLARGRRVNREFAFISYSNPVEAARAVHWLDGCRLPDMEKDKNGVTVEYENGESEAGGNNMPAGATAALAVAAQ